MTDAGGWAANQIGLEAVFQTTQYQKGLQTYLRGLQQANAATGMTAKTIGGFGTAISVALGNAIYNVGAKALNFLVTGLTSVVKGAIQATGELQNLTIMLETLAAKEMVQSGAAFSMADALDKAGERAQAMLADLRDLSVASPFEYKDVVQVYRLNLAFGQGSEMAMKLTGAILDMAAGMGLSGPFLERIAYNFSQMSLVGKITMRDVRDLAMAGVDLSSMLRDELGMSIEQVNAALAAGSLTMRDVSQAFVDYADKNFGGAAQRMSRTLQGLQSSFRDLFFFASVDVFGPAAEVVTGALGNIFDKANAIVQSGALKVIGASLEVLARQFLTSGSDIEAYTTGTADKTVAVWQQWALDAATYGSNIIVSFANGIIGGATAVLNALLYIGNIISSWLSPGSPPRLLPDLPEWGSSAMTEFLEGMTAADYDVLKGIQGPLESALRLMIQTGSIGAGAAGELLADLSSQMAEALSGGGALGGGFFDAMMDATGPFGDELSDLVQLSMELATATEGLTAAEEELAAATAATEAAEQSLEDARDRQKSTRADVNKAKLEYNQLVREGASGAELAAALARVNLADAEATAADEAATAAEAGLETAGEAEDAAQAHLEIIEAQVDAMEELVSLQEQLLQQLLELTQSQIVPPELVPAGAAGGAGAPAGGVGGLPIPEIPKFELPELDLSDFSGKLDAIIKEAKKKLSYLQIEFYMAWNYLFGPRKGIISTMAKAAWERISADLTAYFGVWLGWWTEHGDSVKTILDAIPGPDFTTRLKDAGKAIFDFGEYLTGVFNEDNAGKIKILGEAVDLLAAIISGDTEGMKQNFGELVSALIDYRSWNEIIFDDVQAKVQGVIDQIAIGWHAFWTNMFTVAHEKALEIWTAIVTKFEEIKASIGITLEAIKIVWETKWEEIRAYLQTKWEEMNAAIATAVELVKTTIGAKVAEIKKAWEDFWQGVYDFVDEILNGDGGIVATLQTAADTMSTTIGGWITALNNLINKIKAAILEWKKLLGLKEDEEDGGTGGQSFAGTGTTTTPSRVVKTSFPTASHPISTSIYNKTVNMGGMTVNSAIDMAAMKIWLRQAIREEMS